MGNDWVDIKRRERIMRMRDIEVVGFIGRLALTTGAIPMRVSRIDLI